MPTEKSRLNITLSPELEEAVEKLAQRDQLPKAGKAVELLLTAIEIEEDQVWDVIASKRDTKGAKYFPHKKAWA
ncbi:MAG: hypothetical protein WEC39_02010 [Patescibacteria group bacterium]